MISAILPSIFIPLVCLFLPAVIMFRAFIFIEK